MTKHTVSGCVPATTYTWKQPIHNFAEGHQPMTKPYPTNPPGRTITVTTESKAVAQQLASVFRNLELDGVANRD